MFTGIIKAVATIDGIRDFEGIRTFDIEFPAGFCTDLEIGASVSIDGTCLTVTEVVTPTRATFDVMQQSLDVTTLGLYTQGSRVNAERASKEGAEIGGHVLSGHVDFCTTVNQVRQVEANYAIRINVPQTWLRYIFAKGYIAINGASLTISEVNKTEGWFEVCLIPETRRATVFEDKRADSALNIEIDRTTQVIVDTVERIMAEKLTSNLLPQTH
ncbi:riboflavin synthase subunit alpha [Aquirhabdus sp.]|uniref:riboflavin synthase subunit alpha n=1 Tax=Aquirhabdus sp. TaxID=2824160 RepID=UPI00396C6AE7